MNNQVLVLKEGEVKFNLPLKLRKSFVVYADDQEQKLNTEDPTYSAMPENFKNLSLVPGKYFWGYANVEQVDMQGDLFPIATLEDLAPGLTKAPYNKVFLFHNYEDIAIGTIIATATDSRGLLILAKLNEDHNRAYEVWQSILNGSLDGFSMGGSFIEVESYYDETMDMVVSVAKKAIASEVSLTSIPVNGGSLLQGAFQKAKKKYTEKFGNPQIFMKGQKVENGENFKYNKSQDKSMDTSKFSKEQKEVFDKMVSEGKSEDDAYKEVMAQQKKEAAESVNEDLTGNDSKKACDKKMKKSAETETEEPEEPETPEEETPEEPENPETPEEPETPETPEEPEDKTDYKAEYEKAMEENKLLREKIAGFEKAAKPEKKEKTEEKPMRKSAKAPEEQTPNPSHSTQKSESTPFLSWLSK